MDLSKEKKQRRKAAPDLSTMIYGKVPPQAVDVETAILGIILLEKDAFDQVVEFLKPECFYRDAHQKIFAAMCIMNQRSQSIDQLTLVEELRRIEQLEECGGPYFIIQLTNAVSSGAHVTHYCRIVYERFIKREIIRISGEMISEAYEDASDAFQLMDHADKSITDLTLKRVGNKIPGVDSLIMERFQRVNDLRKNANHLTGITSGFQSIDRITHGWQETDLIVLAARPSVGKTALAIQLGRNAAKSKNPVSVVIFSLEMSAGQLTDRLLSSESEIWLDRISNGMMEEDHMKQLYEKGLQPLSTANIFIDDTPALNIYELRAKARILKRKQNIGLIIIDYLQLMSAPIEGRYNRENEISTISRNLKALAKELKISIIALSQLSREPEKRKGDLKMPQLSDLRESGAIEQDADMVMTMYRPEYYDEANNEMGESTKGETHISILKHRNGKLAKGKEVIKLRADLNIQKFYEWDSLIDVQKQLGAGNWKPLFENKDDQF